MEIFKLILVGLVPIALAVGFWLLETYTKFGKIKKIYRQLIVGVAFGASCCMATEFGSNIGGAILNVRDASAIVAGLLYGFPAGLTAGLIGGLERFFSTYWSNAYYTQWACTISTFISGVASGLAGTFLFRNRKVPWYFGLVAAAVLETFHIMMIFFTNVDDPIRAFSFVQKVGVQMIAINTSIVFFTILLIQIMDNVHTKTPFYFKSISQWSLRTQISLGMTIAAGILIVSMTLVSYSLASRSAYDSADRSLVTGVKDVSQEVSDQSDNTLLARAYLAAAEIYSQGTVTSDEQLATIIEDVGVSEMHYIGTDGIVKYTTVPTSKGFDMHSGAQSSEFLCLLSGAYEYVQSYQTITQSTGESGEIPITDDDGNPIKRKYAGVAMSFGGFIQVGFNQNDYYSTLHYLVAQSTTNRHIGNEGYLIVADDIGRVLLETGEYAGSTLISIGLPSNYLELKPYSGNRATVYGTDFRYTYTLIEGYTVVGLLPISEILFSRDMTQTVSVFTMIIVYSLLLIASYWILDWLVLRGISSTNVKLAAIAAGDLDQRMTDMDSLEFSGLSTSINTTVDALKGHIEKEANRYKEDLELGHQMQLSSLPGNLEYLDNPQFDIFASMTPAKEVGGDFYDFFPLPGNKMLILIADVSGKGIPAALFMMRCKTMIKSFAETGLSAEDVLERTSTRLTEGNEMSTFVTVWLGIIDLETGDVTYANGGHNPPLIGKPGQFHYLQSKADFVLGTFPNIPYHHQTAHLEPGEAIFLYTDGVTEADRGNRDFYGEGRLLTDANEFVTYSPGTICKGIFSKVEEFVAGNEQSDDITMLCFVYHGKAESHQISFGADISEIDLVMDESREFLVEQGVDRALINKVILSIEEIATNIIRHARAEGKLVISVTPVEVSLVFADRGKRFDPLAKEDPDITLSAKDRQIGGLGVFMVKNLSSKMFYSYQHKQNVLFVFFDRTGGK